MSDVEQLRNQTFQRLRPACVQLGNIAIRASVKDHRGLLEALNELYSQLRCVQQEDEDSALDPTLGEYVFFPLSHLLRKRDQLGDREKELLISCLHIVVEDCWRTVMKEQLALQLLVMLTFLIGADPGKESATKAAVSEECQLAGIECALATVITLSSSRQYTLLRSKEARPSLAHLITVALKIIQTSKKCALQTATCRLLDELIVGTLAEGNIAAAFVPGIVSTFSKVLGQNTSPRRHFSSIVASLYLLRRVIVLCFDDSDLMRKKEASHVMDVARTEAWIMGSKAQVKVALEGIIHAQLRAAHSETKCAIMEFCGSLICRCAQSLDTSLPLLLETLIGGMGDTDPSVTERASIELSRARVQSSNTAAFNEILQDSLYSWTLALPRVLQGAEEAGKTIILTRVRIAVEQLSAHALLSDVIVDFLFTNLSHVLKSQSKRITTASSGVNTNMLLDAGSSMSELQVALPERVELTVFRQVDALVRTLGSRAADNEWRHSLLSQARVFAKDGEWALWMAIKLAEGIATQAAGQWLVDDGLNADDTQDLHTICVSVLDRTASSPLSHSSVWQMHALEGISLIAQVEGNSFRERLLDTLYPVVHLLANEEENLRIAARMCLDRIMAACEYSSLTTLLLENVDYLVNAVALKLNTFEVSANAPNVLLVLIKLGGAGIVPYLDDLIDSLFVALENYHGYTRLTETIFQVLHAVVHVSNECGTKVLDQHRGGAKHLHRTMTRDMLEEQLQQLLSPRPRNGQEAETSERTEVDVVPHVHSNPQTTAIVQKIAHMSQYYLTHASTQLRMRILDLLQESLGILSVHENDFLPLVHELWPLILNRLRDREMSMVPATFRMIRALCMAGGEFMSARINKSWPQMKQVYETQLLKRSGATITSQEELVDAFSGAMRQILVSCWLEENVFDEMLRVCMPRLDRDEALRECFELVNPDALWLARHKGDIFHPPMGENTVLRTIAI